MPSVPERSRSCARRGAARRVREGAAAGNPVGPAEAAHATLAQGNRAHLFGPDVAARVAGLVSPWNFEPVVAASKLRKTSPRLNAAELAEDVARLQAEKYPWITALVLSMPCAMPRYSSTRS